MLEESLTPTMSYKSKLESRCLAPVRLQLVEVVSMIYQANQATLPLHQLRILGLSSRNMLRPLEMQRGRASMEWSYIMQMVISQTSFWRITQTREPTNTEEVSKTG